MLDLATERGRLISAALGLAAERRWEDVSLADIAERAGCPLVSLKAHFDGKGAIIAAFASLVDDEVLRRAPRRAEGEAARDALFEAIMCRFDVLEPFKGALRSMARDASLDPARVAPLLNSQRWTLEAAGISADGLEGGLRVAGVASVYAATFRTWLDDDDAGLARTMAALDRRLRRGEQLLHRLKDVRAGIAGVLDFLSGARRSRRSRSDPTTDEPAQREAAPQPQPHPAGPSAPTSI